MARKRNTGTDSSAAAAAAPAREKRVTAPRAKHTPAAVVEAAKPVESAPVAAVTPVITEIDTPYSPSFDEISALAYSYWEARGYQGGCPDEDWARAESELRARGPVQA